MDSTTFYTLAIVVAGFFAMLIAARKEKPPLPAAPRIAPRREPRKTLVLALVLAAEAFVVLGFLVAAMSGPFAVAVRIVHEGGVGIFGTPALICRITGSSVVWLR